MTTFGHDLIQALDEALSHAKGQGPAVVHTPVTPHEIRKQASLIRAHVASLMDMSPSGYRRWEQETCRITDHAFSPEAAQ